MLLFSPLRSEAAEMNELGGGEIGAVVDESDILRPDVGDTPSETLPEATIPTEEESEGISVSDGNSVSSSVSSSDVLDVSGSDVSGSNMLSSGVLDVSGSNMFLQMEDSFGKYYPLYESYEKFMESPLLVTRYENEVLKKLEFIQYALAISVALLFLLIFKRK